jgi:TPR repeat protein
LQHDWPVREKPYNVPRKPSRSFPLRLFRYPQELAVRQRAGWIAVFVWMAVAGNAMALSGAELSAEFDRGLKAYDAKQYPAAFQIWWQIKDEDLAAMRNVALMLRKGLGVPKDPRKAEAILRTAAATGMSNAQVDLAEMYLNGETGPPRPKRALPLLKRAADAGHPLGQYLLGQMYEDGNGVPKDINRAAELYISSARGGLAEAKERLASLDQDRTGKHGSPKPPEQPAHGAGQSAQIASAYVVQLGSFKTVEEAEAQWSRLRKNPTLASLPHQLEEADLRQKGVWHRLLVAGGPGREPAAALCDQLKAAGQQCLVRRAVGQTLTAASGK